MNKFQLARDNNGSVMINGVEYAIGQQPQLDNRGSIVAYISYGFSENDLDNNGEHDPLFDPCVNLAWDCTEWWHGEQHEEFDCDWENDFEQF